MRFYKVYEIDRTDHIRDARLIEASDDQQALNLAAKSRRLPYALEVWDHIRFIGRVDASTASVRQLEGVAA